MTYCQNLTPSIVTMATIPQLSSSGDTTVRLWDVVGGALLTTFKAHTGSVKSVDVKKDEPSEWCCQGRKYPGGGVWV